MKIKVLFLTLISILTCYLGKAQVPTREDSLQGFSMKEMEHHLERFTGTLEERNARIERSKKAFIQRKYKLGVYAPPKIINGKLNGTQNIETINCTNIDFEQGTTNGWTITGASSVTSGAGTDPFGGFPVVFSGNYSCQLNNDLTSNSTFNTTATRVLSIPSTGVNFFKLSFAIDILDYPHDSAASAKFFIKFFDAAGNQLPCPHYQCTYYQNSGGAGVSVGVSNFQNTNCNTGGCTGNCGYNIGSQCFPVTYAPWQTIALDLSAYNGTNITCQVICDWCIYQYDFGYCYIDAECPTSATPPGGNCGSLPFTLGGPTGMDTYSWTPPPGNNPSTSNTSTITASVAGTYTLHATLNTCSVTAYTFTYTVGSGPTASFTDVMNGGCSGNGSFTSTSSANGGAPISSYVWEWGDGTGNGSGANTTHNFVSSGTKTVTLVVSNGGCTDSVSQTVVVPPHPTASFTPTNNCLNAVSNFVSTSTSSVAINTQNWNFGDGVHGTGATQTHTYGTAGTYSVTLAITDANSCTDSITQTITINPLPVITVNSPSICGGIQTATLTAAGANTYSWSPGLSAPMGNPVTGTPTVTTIYTVTGTDANSCVNTATTAINISANPTITATNATICMGQQTGTLTAGGGVSYTWTPATLTPTTGSVVTGSPATTTQYTVTGTNAGGCVGTATAVINVNPLPTVTVNSSTICLAQQTATLTAAGANTYSWSPGLSAPTGNPVTGTPTTTTTYTVAGTDANGCINTANSTITVLPASILSVNSSTICIGEQVAVLTVGGAATYSWSPSTTLSSSTAPTVTATPAVTTSYTITAVNPSGCVSTTTSTVTVNPLPIITVNSSTICIGQQTATLTAQGANTYTWTPATGLNTIFGSPVLGTPNVATNYTVAGTDLNGCINIATTNIALNALPVPTITSNTPCASQQALSFNCSPNGMTSYSWSGPNSFSSSIQNPTIPVTNVTASTAGIYTVSVMDVNTCTNTATIDVTVNPLPVVTVNSPTVCENQTINFNCLPNGDSYSWSGPGGIFTSNLQNPSIANAIPSMSGNYAVTVTDANGCKNANVSQVIVYSLPVINANTATICMGQQSATLTATGAFSYTWTPWNSLSGSFGSPVIATPNTTTAYTVSGTDNNGCQSFATTTVSVFALPVIATSSVTPTCVPLNATFSVTSNPAASSYVWNFSNGQNSNPVTLNPSSAFTSNTTYTAAGTYPVHLTVTDINGCVSTATTIAISYPIPVADFDYGPQPVTILDPQIQFYNESVYANQYAWNFGDINSNNNIDSVVNPSHTYPGIDSATYYVTLSVTSINGCTASVVKPVKILETYALYVPNAFTPNGDGKNEMFMAEGVGINSFKMYIYDRWGNNLFYTDDINKGWEGNFLGKGSQLVQEDVYVWKIEVIDFANTQRSLHGTVTLLR